MKALLFFAVLSPLIALAKPAAKFENVPAKAFTGEYRWVGGNSECDRKLSVRLVKTSAHGTGELVLIVSPLVWISEPDQAIKRHELGIGHTYLEMNSGRYSEDTVMTQMIRDDFKTYVKRTQIGLEMYTVVGTDDSPTQTCIYRKK